MEPGCALAVFAGMYLKIYSCVSLGERAHWGLCTKPFVGWGRFHPASPLIMLSHQLTPNVAVLPYHEGDEGLPAPQKSYESLYTVSDIKDFWLILQLFHFGSNSACIFRFTFILNYAVFSGGKLNERIFSPLPGSICWRGIAIKENNPWGELYGKKWQQRLLSCLLLTFTFLAAVLFMQGGNKATPTYHRLVKME